jgi:hypothetical protein
MTHQRIFNWLDESGHIATQARNEIATLRKVINECDQLCLEYIRKYAVRRYEPQLIDELVRKNFDLASAV